MRERGRRVLQLEGGEPFMTTPEFVKEAMREALDKNHTRYAPSSGIPELREALRVKVSRQNSIEVSAEDIIVTPGGGHGLFCAFLATMNPGDEVLCFGPYWTPVKDAIDLAGGVVVTLPWSEVRADGQPGDDGSSVADIMRKALESRLTPRMRVIYANTPANPTGDVLVREQLTAIADFAKEHDLIVISDEAYEDIIYDLEHVSIASFPGMFERTITVYTFSKTYAMTGWRIGYTIAPPDLMECLQKFVLASVNGVSTPTQYAALAAVTSDLHSLSSLREEYRSRRDLLLNGLRGAGFDCVTPGGTFYSFPDVRRRLGDDSWNAMETLLERTSIAAVPGVIFGPEGEGHLRMSFSTSVETLEEAVSALKKL